MKKFTVAVLIKNEFGALNRVTSMFRRRQFNIVSLTVSETETPEYSRITVQYFGEAETNRLLTDQLKKSPAIYSVTELNEEDSLFCELMLIKMANTPETRTDINNTAQAFGATTVEYTDDSIALRMTDNSNRIDRFVELMKQYKILEVCRTGAVSLKKNSKTADIKSC